MLPLADRYLFLEWIKIFVLVLAATFGLQLIVEIQDSFADLLGYGASLATILRYYAILAPSFLTISLPASILVSALYVLGAMHRNNEFVALRAAGMSVFRVTRTIWAAGLVLSALLWHLNASLIPWSVESSRRLWQQVEFAYEADQSGGENVGIERNLAFDNRREGRMWHINRYSLLTEMASGVMVSLLDEDRREVARAMARRGFFEGEDEGWVLQEGRLNKYDPERRELLAFEPFERRGFPELGDDPRFMLLLEKRPKDLSFRELRRVVERFSVEERPETLGYRVRLQSLVAGAASCLIVVGLAVPFAVAGVRTSPVVGVSKSIGLFFAYYVLSGALNALGQQGYVSPAAAAWTPNGLMIVLAYVFMRLVR